MILSRTRSRRLMVLRDFLFISDRLRHPGLSRQLDLHPQNVLFGALEENLRYDEKRKQLSIRYQIPKKLCSAALGGKLPLSSFLSFFDDISTWNLVCEDRWRRPGVSTHLQAELGPAGLKGCGVNPGDIIDIRTSVVKVGRILGIAHAEAIDVDSGEVICIGRHTKYMPASLVQNALLGPLMPLTKMCTSYMTKGGTKLLNSANASYMTKENSRFGKELSLDELFQFQGVSENRRCGRINVVDDHNNQHGTCHGGSQAIMMELLGLKSTGNDYIASGNPLLKSISVTYLSPGKGTLDLSVEDVVEDEHATCLCVKVQSEQGNLISEGVLTFRTDHK